jgi:hypothetical protein
LRLAMQAEGSDLQYEAGKMPGASMEPGRVLPIRLASFSRSAA